MEQDLVRSRVILYGRVQGVFFRDSMRERAHAQGVNGWVCNRSDGGLEAVLEGSPDAVEQLIRFAESGPPRARVHEVEVFEEEPEGLTGFQIR